MKEDKIEIQIYGDVSLNGLFCDPQYFGELGKTLNKFSSQLGVPDIRIINWEAPITDSFEFNENKQPIIATTKSSALVFCENFKVDIACLGNNHIGDCLDEGFLTTSHFLSERNISTFGASNDKFKVCSPLSKIVKERQIAFLSFVGKETNPKIHQDSNIYINFIDENNIYDSIRENKKIYDILIITLHWGIEYNQYPSQKQRDIARKCIDSGANLIIGHHSHCLQGVEEYKNGLIFYSLGNFIFSGIKGREGFGWPSFCNKSGMFKLMIDKSNKITYEFIPFLVTNNGIDFSDFNKLQSINYLQIKLSKYFNLNIRLYKVIFYANSLFNWFIRIPIFLIKIKGGILKAFLFYCKLKYFKVIYQYLFK